MILCFRRDDDRLAAEDGGDPFRRPGALRGIIDCGQRLQRDGLGRIVRQRAAEIMPVAAHGERGRADRAAEVEGEDLASRIAAELQRHQRQQHGLAGAGRTDHQRMADIADMQRKAKRGRSLRSREEQRRCAQMLVSRRPRPDRRQRDHMREIERRDRRLADIGVDMAGQRPEPGLDRVDALDHAGEVASLDDLLDQPQLLVGDADIVVPDRDRGGDEGLPDRVGAEFLQRRVGIDRLVVGVGVEQRRGFVGHHLLQDRGDRFALGEPLPPDLGQQPRRISLVEHDRAGRPAIGKGEPVEFVQNPGRRRGREPDDRQHPQMRIAQHRLEAAGQRLIGQHARRDTSEFRARGRAGAWSRQSNADRSAFPRHRATAFGHEAFDELKHAVGAVDEAALDFARIGISVAIASLVEETLGSRRVSSGGGR